MQQSPVILDLSLKKNKIKLPEQGNSMIIVASAFSKSSVFKMYSIHTKMQSWCFQIPLV